MSEDSAAPVRRSSRQRALAEKKKLEESDVRMYCGVGGEYFNIFVLDISNINDSCLILYKKCLQAKVDNCHVLLIKEKLGFLSYLICFPSRNQ